VEQSLLRRTSLDKAIHRTIIPDRTISPDRSADPEDAASTSNVPLQSGSSGASQHVSENAPPAATAAGAPSRGADVARAPRSIAQRSKLSRELSKNNADPARPDASPSGVDRSLDLPAAVSKNHPAGTLAPIVHSKISPAGEPATKQALTGSSSHFENVGTTSADFGSALAQKYSAGSGVQRLQRAIIARTRKRSGSPEAAQLAGVHQRSNEVAQRIARALPTHLSARVPNQGVALAANNAGQASAIPLAQASAGAAVFQSPQPDSLKKAAGSEATNADAVARRPVPDSVVARVAQGAGAGDPLKKAASSEVANADTVAKAPVPALARVVQGSAAADSVKNGTSSELAYTHAVTRGPAPEVARFAQATALFRTGPGFTDPHAVSFAVARKIHTYSRKGQAVALAPTAGSSEALHESAAGQGDASVHSATRASVTPVITASAFQPLALDGVAQNPPMISSFGTLLLERYEGTGVGQPFQPIVGLQLRPNDVDSVITPAHRVFTTYRETESPGSSYTHDSETKSASISADREEQVAERATIDTSTIDTFSQNETGIGEIMSAPAISLAPAPFTRTFLLTHTDNGTPAFTAGFTAWPGISSGVASLRHARPMNVVPSLPFRGLSTMREVNPSRARSVAGLPHHITWTSQSPLAEFHRTAQSQLEVGSQTVNRVFRSLSPPAVSKAVHAIEYSPEVARSNVLFPGAATTMAHLQRFDTESGSVGDGGSVGSVPTLPSLSQSEAGNSPLQASGPDLSVLADKVYDLLVRRLATERQRRGF
jgi:hypothetical protein